MPTGPEHYRKAEELIAYAGNLDKHDEDVPLTLAEAQVHATLALTAATALPNLRKRYSDFEPWAELLGEPLADHASDGGGQ